MCILHYIWRIKIYKIKIYVFAEYFSAFYKNEITWQRGFIILRLNVSLSISSGRRSVTQSKNPVLNLRLL